MDLSSTIAAELAIDGLTVAYGGGRLVLDRLNLKIPSGESLAILGPSGCGKTTLLRAIAGLEPVRAGRICINQIDHTRTPPHHRGLAMVFQNQSPYPHMSVRDNLSFSARHRGVTGANLERVVDQTAHALRIEHLLDRYPVTLSGGERQRLVLGRAIACRPRLLLLDEPFSNLDAPLRADLRRDLTAWRRQTGTTCLLVTHDQADAASLADRIAIMDRGVIIQTGTPRQLHERPATRLVGQLVGEPPLQFLPGTLRLAAGCLVFQLAETDRQFPVSRDLFQNPLPPTLDVEIGFRPHEVQIVPADTAASSGRQPVWYMPCRLTEMWTLSDQARALVSVADHHLLSVRLNGPLVAPRSEACPAESPSGLCLVLDPIRLHWFDARTQLRLQ